MFSTFKQILRTYCVVVPARKRTLYPTSWCDSRLVTAPRSSCRARQLAQWARHSSSGFSRRLHRRCPPAPICSSSSSSRFLQTGGGNRRSCHQTHWSSRSAPDAILRSLYVTPDVYSYSYSCTGNAKIITGCSFTSTCMLHNDLLNLNELLVISLYK